MAKQPLREMSGRKPGETSVPAQATVCFPRDDRYRCVPYGLTGARTDEEIVIPAWSVTVQALDGTASIRLNNVANDPIPLAAGDEFEFDVEKLYLTNTAQTGKTLVLSFWWREEEGLV
jgi:hypothetical protein